MLPAKLRHLGPKSKSASASFPVVQPCMMEGSDKFVALPSTKIFTNLLLTQLIGCYARGQYKIEAYGNSD